ncbi:hypothetical protein ACLB2K_001353 [Fragaria x ananassa]|uniref:uncharacterized protein LOC105351416 n=1 Tax=Fragaria vesca subsp. vesca TaxID=101020 RepID=UPI0005C9B5EF|nr:PREDICTED: uncharacterized protein LOC105351416 [Fragaria vesca subsp. vesca]
MKLTVFEYHSFCKLERNVFLNAPRMSDLYFHRLAENKIPALLSQSNAAQVEILTCGLFSEKILVMPRSTIQFWNLKQLELTVEIIDDLEEGLDVLLVFSFLKASPLLQSSNLGVCHLLLSSLQRQVKVKELKEVEILGCEGNWCKIELAIYVMQRAQCLDKLVFNPSASHYPADGEWLKSFQYWSWLEWRRETVRRKHQAKVPASVELVLL